MSVVGELTEPAASSSDIFDSRVGGAAVRSGTDLGVPAAKGASEFGEFRRAWRCSHGSSSSSGHARTESGAAAKKASPMCSVTAQQSATSSSASPVVRSASVPSRLRRTTRCRPVRLQGRTVVADVD